LLWSGIWTKAIQIAAGRLDLALSSFKANFPFANESEWSVWENCISACWPLAFSPWPFFLTYPMHFFLFVVFILFDCCAQWKAWHHEGIIILSFESQINFLVLVLWANLWHWNLIHRGSFFFRRNSHRFSQQPSFEDFFSRVVSWFWLCIRWLLQHVLLLFKSYTFHAFPPWPFRLMMEKKKQNNNLPSLRTPRRPSTSCSLAFLQIYAPPRKWASKCKMTCSQHLS
jgi:hypothetical protein